MEILKNTSYDYIVSYIRSNGNEYHLIGHRQTSKGGSVFDGNGKCLQHTFQFAGWRISEQRIVRGEDGKIEDRIWQEWVRKDGSRFNARRFENKNEVVEWVRKYISKNETSTKQ